MTEAITTQLVGGLGNQLFCYYAGAALAAHLGVSLKVDTSIARYGITDHGIRIQDFRLPGEWLREDKWYSGVVPHSQHLVRLKSRLESALPPLSRALRIYTSREVGWDPNLLQQRPGTRLRGHFQSWRIVNCAVREGYPRKPMLRTANEWLLCLQDRSRSEQPIAVHVRRGDYERVGRYRLLGTGYYARAIARLRAQGLTGPIWVFSDEPDKALTVLQSIDEPLEMIRSSDGPSVELLAMASAAGQVIANSTFSWWAAWMSGNVDTVIAPGWWFRNGDRVNGLIPPYWQIIAQD